MTRTLTALCAAALLAAAHRPASGDTLVGPQLGNVTYKGELRIGPDGPDEDAFAGRLVQGERVSLRLVSPFQSPLFPEIVVEGPDGKPRTVSIRFGRPVGKFLELKNWTVPETGIWTFRVRPLLDTQGAYTLRFTIRSQPKVRIVAPKDGGGGGPVTLDVPFEATEGARLEVRAKGRGTFAPQITALRDPGGQAVLDAGGAPAVAATSARKSKVSLDVEALASGDGTYHLEFGAPAGNPGFRATARVIPADRPRGNVRLDPDEPWIAPRTILLRGVKERPVRIDGLHFSTAARPQVLFGDLPGTDVKVDFTGTYLDVTPPKLEEGSLVRVVVVNPDGQAAERPDFFFYVPTPLVEDVLDLSGNPVRGASVAGGRKLRFVGSGFETGVYVRFGGSADVLPQIFGAGEMEVKTPAQEAGVVEIHVLDGFLHDEVVPIQFEFKAPPEIASPAFTPASAAPLETVVLGGTGFEQSDVVLVDGLPVATVWVSDTALSFTVPSTTAGQHTVSVVDRVGTVVPCPKLTVQ